MKAASGYKPPIAVTAIWLLALIISGIAPYDRPTWLLEVFPVLIVLALTGAVSALLMLSRLHDRQLSSLVPKP